MFGYFLPRGCRRFRKRINLHCLRHLRHQIRLFGPLFVFPAMCFQSANRLFGQLFTGTTSQFQMIFGRYLENQALSEKKSKMISYLMLLLHHGQAKLPFFKVMATSCSMFWRLSMSIQLESFIESQQFFRVHVWATGTAILCAISGNAECQLVTFFSRKMVDENVEKYIIS